MNLPNSKLCLFFFKIRRYTVVYILLFVTFGEFITLQRNPQVIRKNNSHVFGF